MELDESDPKVNIYYIKKKILNFLDKNNFFFFLLKQKIDIFLIKIVFFF
jgi:hypothetical protein